MKILALRGQNLASLPEIDVDFDGGPLADTRLFAITGPTGAGKSTLLDAICLALYDRVPRLLSAREAAGDVLELPASDPRSIVRRGAAEARAEVDFISKDGLRLTATWEVWRARKRADGRLQPQRMRLVSTVDGRELSGATKTETLEIIRDKVGLSFDEFRRAVLLAQGDFAAFLAAKPDERAALLERMTGTQLYAAISEGAYARAKREDEALARLEQSQAGLSLLQDHERAEAVRRVEGLSTRRSHLDARADVLRGQVSWYEAERKLVSESEAADQALQAAEAAWAAAAPRRDDLALAREAELLRPAHQALVNVEQAIGRARQRAEALTETFEEAQVQLTARDALASAAAQRFDEAQAAIARRAPEIAQARRLDGAIQEAEAACAQERDHQSARARAEGETAEQRSVAQTNLEETEAAKHSLDAWLSAQTATRVVAAQWPRWSQELDRYRQAHEDAAKALDAARSAEQVRLRAERREQAARERLDAVSHELTEAAEQHAAGAAELAELDATATRTSLGQALALLAEHRTHIASLERMAKRVRRLHRDRREAELRGQQATEAAERAAQERSAAEARVAEATAALERARVARARVEATEQLAMRRQELLADNVPCPLCGSTDHPAAGTQTPATNPAEPEAEQVEARQRAVEAHTGALERAREDHRVHERARVEAQEDVVRHTSEIEGIGQTWRGHVDGLARAWLESALLGRHGLQKIALILPERPKLTGSTKEIVDALARLDGIRAELLTLTERQDELNKRLQKIRGRQDSLQSRRGATQAEVDGASGARNKADQALNEAQSAHRSAAQRAAEARAVLEEPLSRWPGWPERMEADPAQFAAQVQVRVQTYEARALERQQLEARLEEASRAAELARERDEVATAALLEARKKATDRAAHLDRLTRERAELLGGQTVEAFEAAQTAAHDEAQAAAKTATALGRTAKETYAAAQASLQAAQQSRAEAETTHAAEAAGFAEALRRSRIQDREGLERMLDRGPTWLEGLEQTLEALEAERVRAQTTAADRAERLRVHRSEAAPELKETQARDELEETKATLQTVVDEVAQIRAALTADEQARAELATLAPKIAQQRAALELWSELSALIGSADGRKFRTFAQGLTLDVLVEQANLHLCELRPRYTLRRVTGQAMELAVIDHDIGDEVRFISTLSGGERFLVSLALALGLSTLSSKNVRIESLFIDEGFGALDANTLEIALTTLDQLQAEGRTVGIISHVADLAERIGFRVEVRPTGPGTSEVRIRGV